MPIPEWVIYCGIVALLTCLIWLYTGRKRSSERNAGSSERHSPTRRSSRKRAVKRTNFTNNHFSVSSLTSASSSKNSKRRRTKRSGRLDGDDDVTDYSGKVKMESPEDGDTTVGRKTKRRKDGHDIDIDEGGATSKHKSDPSIGQSKSNFSHPVYKQMSLKNGAINRMTLTELRTTLQELNVNSLGSGDVLKRRLKNYYTTQALKTAGLESEVPARFDYFCVIDVEATCLEINPLDYIHEIIEFPIVLLNARTWKIEDTFEAFCKPVVNPKLSKFCSQLTNITQRMVDKADEFPAVLKRVEAWMKSKELGSKHTFAIVTDCSLDMDLYLKLQCLVSEIPYPDYAREWINISKVFANIYKTKRMPLRTMLTNVGLTFQGQPHRGIDDAKNIARVTIQLLTDGADLKLNEKLTST